MTHVLIADDVVSKLLEFGESDAFDPETWPDYLARFGLTHEHVPALIRLACDPDLNDLTFHDPRAWAPMYAWRALGQLRAEAAIEPLLALRRRFWDYEVIIEEIPTVVGMIGPAAMPAIRAFIDEELPRQPTEMGAGTEALRAIARWHPETRSLCVAALTDVLARHAEADPTANGMTICSLLDLKAVEAIETIRAAFEADSVDLSMAGDLEDVEIDLGLRQERATKRPHYITVPGFDDWETLPAELPRSVEPRPAPKIGRNAPCPCGSGKKYKKCCLE